MSESASQSELARRNALRLSNMESNRLTRECIETALLILMEDKDLDDITITSIIQKAGVSRSAYYRNYRSKEDILTGVFDEAAQAMVGALSEPIAQRDMRECYQLLFEQVWHARRLFQIVRKAGMADRFQETVNRRYLAGIAQTDVQGYYRVRSWIGSIFNIVFGWIERDCRESAATMARICQSFLSEDDLRFGTSRSWER